MNNIKRIEIIDRKKLSEAFYFESLLEEALQIGLLNSDEINKIKMDCIALLAEKSKRYSGGDSSILIDIAESMMKSIIYTVGLHLKSFPNPDDAVDLVRKTDLSELYILGRKKINTKLRVIKQLYYNVLKNMADVNYTVYISTIKNQISPFFKFYTAYHADYFAHELPYDFAFDYPLCNPADDFIGIEYMQQYLTSVYYENIFCGYFPVDSIRQILYSYDIRYNELIFNICEKILTAALGCIISGDIYLNVSNYSFDNLSQILSAQSKSRNEIESEIMNAYNKLIKDLGITNIYVLEYMKKVLPTIALPIFTAKSGQ